MTVLNAFLLSYLKYGDHDAILHCFTQENGFHSFYAKGIYSSRHKKKPYLFPLNHLVITVNKTLTENLMAPLSKVELPVDYLDFNDVKANSILFFTADFLHQVLRNEGPNFLLFEEIESLRIQIHHRNFDAYLIFLVKFLRISGLAPLAGNGDFLNPESGLFDAEISHNHFDKPVSTLWNSILNCENYDQILQRQDRSLLLDSIIIYCHYHINDFYTPNSLAVVRQIFE